MLTKLLIALFWTKILFDLASQQIIQKLYPAALSRSSNCFSCKVICISMTPQEQQISLLALNNTIVLSRLTAETQNPFYALLSPLHYS